MVIPMAVASGDRKDRRASGTQSSQVELFTLCIWLTPLALLVRFLQCFSDSICYRQPWQARLATSTSVIQGLSKSILIKHEGPSQESGCPSFQILSQEH